MPTNGLKKDQIKDNYTSEGGCLGNLTYKSSFVENTLSKKNMSKLTLSNNLRENIFHDSKISDIAEISPNNSKIKHISTINIPNKY
ncbi:hypothetical protein BpHYR1_002839 [Brachionus plicatilis]|uniref:Uncharacterized protein n=1 Tax=Brachionus plicatilis TaxID=10195 RepID=A0A3M7SDV5_BRAPC|nr:hypothetical protein BpHYR1_002839 [Brachionus plicatilis]